MGIKYYKAMNKNMTCQNFQYEIGGIYEIANGTQLRMCYNGFHFCDILNECFHYYDEKDCVVCEVLPLGETLQSKYFNKLVTSKIKIVKQLSDKEIEEQKYNIQNGIKMIGERCFENCKNLEKINIPNSVVSIKESAFEKCINLKRIIIPSNVESIGMDAFHDCKSLQKITIPKNITRIYSNAFMNCNNLKEIKIFYGVKFLGSCCFVVVIV